jgi:protein SCO1
MRLFALALCLIALTACGAAATQTPAMPTSPPIRAYPTPRPINDFILTTQDNSPFTRADLTGKFTVITFGFTRCPDVCPVNLSNMEALSVGLGPDAEKVRFVFVSVDGQRDTPAVLKSHLALFNKAAILGLTGEDLNIQPLAVSFGVEYRQYTPPGGSDYLIEHTASTFLVNPQGEIIRLYRYAAPFDDVLADLKAAVAG